MAQAAARAKRLVRPRDRLGSARGPEPAGPDARSGAMLGLRPDSSMIDRVLFDDEAGTLRIWFRPTREQPARQYLYHEVPRAMFDSLARARSAGRFFNAAIRGRFRCEPVGRRFRPPG